MWLRSPGIRDAAMLWAASCKCFFGFLWVGKTVVPSDSGFDPAVCLAYGDVRVDNWIQHSCVEVLLKASKIDPFCRGVSVYLGRTDRALCPVAAILDYMVHRGLAPGPFFTFSDGCYLTRERFVSAVKAVLEAAGILASQYTGYSFRIGQPPQQLMLVFLTH